MKSENDRFWAYEQWTTSHSPNTGSPEQSREWLSQMSVQQMIGSVYLMLTRGGEEEQPEEKDEKQPFSDLPQNVTNFL